MISNSIINAVLKSSAPYAKDNLIKMLLAYISNSDYNNGKVNHLLEILVDDSALVKPKDINMDYIKENPNLIIWNYERYNIKDIELEKVDNVDCVVTVSYKYIEDKDDDKYINTKSNISFIDFPEVLKKS